MAHVHLAPYGKDFTVDFELYEPTGVDLIATAVHASGDITVYEDQGTAATADNGFTDEGALYSLVCSAAELTGKRATYAIVDQTGTKVWLDKVITVETYGHPLSMHPFIGMPSYELAGAGAPQAVDATTVTLPTGADNTDNDSYNAVVMVEDGFPPMIYYGTYAAATRVFTFSPAPGLTYTTGAWVGPMKLPVSTGSNLTEIPWNAAWDAEVQSEAQDALTATFGSQTTGDLAALITTVDTVVDGIQTDLSNGTDGLGAIKADTAAILVDTGTTLQANLNSIIAAVITNAAGADIAADIIALDAVADAIKVITDQVTFTKANEVDVNLISINDVTITGDGSTTPFDV